MAIAVYAGTFDPITNGHRDVVERAVKIFGKVFFAVAESPSKNPLFTVGEREELAKLSLADLGGAVEVVSFSGLLVDLARKIGASVIVRGLRAVSDYEYESQMAVINRQLDPEIETVFLMTSKSSSFISSSIVRQVAMVNGDVSSMVPEPVNKALIHRFKPRS
jgi:pantetheine-phosphate adenylyltransferase